MSTAPFSEGRMSWTSPARSVNSTYLLTTSRGVSNVCSRRRSEARASISDASTLVSLYVTSACRTWVKWGGSFLLGPPPIRCRMGGVPDDPVSPNARPASAMLLATKKVVVIGGSSGIGEATARLALEHGADVRSEERRVGKRRRGRMGGEQ